MRWSFGLIALVLRGDSAKNAELLVLRHENAVLCRSVGWVRYEPADRAWFAALTRFISRRRWAEVFPVTPATLLAWTASLPRESTTRAGSAGPAGRWLSAASPELPYAWLGRTRCGAIGGSTAS